MHEILSTAKQCLIGRVVSKHNGAASAITKRKRARHDDLDFQQPPHSPHPPHRASRKRTAETGARASFLKARDKLIYLRARSIAHHRRRREISLESRNVGFDRILKSRPLKGHLRGTNHWLLLRPFERERDFPENGEVEDSDIIPDRMHSWVQILTTPTADTPGTTLLLHFDNKRYLIGNIAEGTQRAAVQRNTSLAKVKNIFLTGKVDWSTTGGLVGMILTLADATAAQRAEGIVNKKKERGIYIPDTPKLNVHGGRNLTHLLATTRRFVFRKGMPVNVNEFRETHQEDKSEEGNLEATWKDENISVWAMSISPDISSTSPLKRKSTHDEISEPMPMVSGTALSGKSETREERDDRDDQIRRGVVGHMFDSDWRLDALVTKKLGDVRMPAAIFVRNSEGKIEKYRGLLPGGDEVVPDIDVLIRNPWPGAEVDSLPSTTPSVGAMSYIIKNHPQRGKFNPKSAIEMGVQPGPQFRLLTMGHSVDTANGKVVTPDMVMAPGKLGGGFAVVELPNELYIDNLLKREEWTSQNVMEGVSGIIWILGKGLSADERLSAFRKKFAHLQHIISSTDVCSNQLALESPATAAIKLHLLDPARFPVPVHDNEKPKLHSLAMNQYFRRARVGVILQLEPSFEVQVDKTIGLLDTAQVIKDANDEVLRLAEGARKAINDPSYQEKLADVQKDIPSKDAEVITLGTGSALPSKYRNVSATLLRVPGYGNYLLDCGENTLGQLKRVFGAGLPQVLQDLKVIWISHLHADHHLGTASVIKAWHEETRNSENLLGRKLMVASDGGMLQWLREYSEVEDYGFSRLQLQSMNSQNNYEKQFNASEREIYGLSSIKACPVNHCHGALAVVLTLPNGFKAAYSGDCLPSSDFARIGKDATLLIHEATFDDELAGDALAKKHSTTSDALRVGKEMGARRILLTHFSQRYQKIPVMDPNSDQVAIVAFDYMRCLLGDFAKLAHFRPALLKLYEEKEEDKKA